MPGRILPRGGAGHSVAVPVQASKPPELVSLLNSSTHLLASGSEHDPAERPHKGAKGLSQRENTSPLPKEGSRGSLYSPLEKAAIYSPFLLSLCASDTQQHSENAVLSPGEAEHLQHRAQAAKGGSLRTPWRCTRGTGLRSTQLSPSSIPAPLPPQNHPNSARSPSTDLYPQLGRLSPRRATITGSLQPWAQTPAPPGEAHRRLPELGWSRVVVPGGGSCPQPCPGHAPSRCSCRDKALQGAQGRRAGGASPCRGGTGSWAGPTPLRVPSAGPHDWDKSP